MKRDPELQTELAADPVREIVRSLPDNFWDVEVWTSDGNWVHGEMDVAQRYRIVRELKRQIDGLVEGAHNG